MELAFMVGLVGGLGIILWSMRRDAPRHETVPVMSTAEDWEKEGEGWKGIGPGDTGAPNYTYPTAARFNLFTGRAKGCPRCHARNVERVKAELPPLKPPFKVRSRDGALFCFYCDEATYPMSEDTVIRYDPRYHSQTK